jgi:hypothetical protein
LISVLSPAGGTIGKILRGGTGSVGVLAVSTAWRSMLRLIAVSMQPDSKRQLCATGFALSAKHLARTSSGTNAQLPLTVPAARCSAKSHCAVTLSRLQTSATCQVGNTDPLGFGTGA